MAHDRCQPYKSPSSCRWSCRRQSRNESHKRGLNTKLHLAVDAHGMPVRAFITQGTTADCTQAHRLIDGFEAEYLLADKAYDSDSILAQAQKQGMHNVIPPKKNRKIQRAYDKHLYKLRHLIENAFLDIKRWRGIATHGIQKQQALSWPRYIFDAYSSGLM